MGSSAIGTEVRGRGVKGSWQSSALVILCRRLTSMTNKRLPKGGRDVRKLFIGIHDQIDAADEEVDIVEEKVEKLKEVEKECGE